jgi:uncharacterized membrane protein
MPGKKNKTPLHPPTGLSPTELATSAVTQQLIFNAAFTQQQSNGPIPPPEMLRQYDAALPGLAARIVEMAEAEAAHRRQIETKTVDTQVSDLARFRQNELLGQVFGLAIGVVALTCATYAAVNGAQWAGSIIGSAGVTGLVTAFILGRHYLIKQRQQEIELARHAQEAQKRLVESSAARPT